MKRLLPFAFCWMFTVVSCHQKDTLPGTFTTRFYKEQVILNDLVASLKKHTMLEKMGGITFKPSQFNRATERRLNALGIIEVYPFSWGDRQPQFDFKTSWRKVTPIHLYYNTLDSVTTQKGYYKKDENSNEIWGLGNHWSLWNEIKLREMDR